MSRINRRDMLKAIAASAGGAAAAAGSGLLAPVTGLAAPTPRPNSGGSPNGHILTARQGPKIAGTAGTFYKSFAGVDFKPRNSSVAYVWGGNLGVYQSTGGPDWMTAKIELPQGSIITEASAFFLQNTAGTSFFYLSYGADDNSAYSDYSGASSTTVAATIQRLDLSFSPLLVDNTTYSYVLYWEPGVASASDVLWGARVGYINAPGMTLFPDPRRIVSGDVTPFTSGTTYGPFDATKKVGGVIASGVPAGASAAFCAVQSYSPGVLTMFPDGAADPGIANYSGTGTSGTGLNMVYMMVPLSAAGKFKIHSYITGKVYVDAWGYAFPPG